ncbi:Ubiquitin family protein [Aphelenchoides fujianensis]|nr:Ubiquitin family protein [Aphelenchoides fujianensis]
MGKRNRPKSNGQPHEPAEDQEDVVNRVIEALHTHNHTGDADAQKKKSQQGRQCRQDAYCIQRLGMENVQIWFNDMHFRRCIYEWREAPDFRPPNAKMDIQAIMNCLQRLFITMQITPYEYTDATELTQLLKLDNEQHDVQEFSILFFDALDRNARLHPNGAKVNQLLHERFEGKTRQIISCKCGKRSTSDTMFRSLQLHINDLTDYRCDVCGKQGDVQRATECVSVPPILMLQLNRYSIDMQGRSKKITSPIQDADPDSKFELVAVMIHEGASSNCGHYYDMIKDPITNTWFSYNDREVSECQKTPGKGCYALIYRKREAEEDVVTLDSEKAAVDLMEVLSLAPQEVVQELEAKLSAKFQDESREGNRSHEIWSSCIDLRHHYLEHMWKVLAVHNGQLIVKDPRSVALLPTDFLLEIQKKEINAVQTMKDLDSLLNGKQPKAGADADDDAQFIVEAIERLGPHNPDEETDEEYTVRLSEMTAVIREERQTSDRLMSAQIRANSTTEPPDDEQLRALYTMEPLGEVRMELCRHGKVDVEHLKTGKVKCVTRKAAEKLLEHYRVGVRLEREGENGDASQPNGHQRESEGLMTGEDLCHQCIELAHKEEEFKRELNNRDQMAQAIIKRFPTKATHVEYPTSDAFYVSRDQLKNYRKMAIQEMNYQKTRGAGPPMMLVFSPKYAAVEEDSPAVNGVEEEGDPDTSIEVPQQKRRRIESTSTNGDEPRQPRSAISKYASSSSASPSPPATIREEEEPKEEKAATLNGHLKGGDASQSEEMDVEPAAENGVQAEANGMDVSRSKSEKPADETENGELAEDVTMEDDESPTPSDPAPSVDARSKKSPSTDDEKEDAELEIVGEVLRTTPPVVFNEKLVCKHGGLDCNAKKVWVFAEEWNELINGKFEKVHTFPVQTDECKECIEQNETDESKKTDCANKIAQLNHTVMKTFRNPDRRFGASDEYRMALCSKFLYRFKNALKVRASQVPRVCQECLLCSKHKRPFMLFQEPTDNSEELKRLDEAAAEVSGTTSLFTDGTLPTNSSYEKRSVGPVPITENEWLRLQAEYSQVCGDEEWSEPVIFEDGAFKDFCVECNEEFNSLVHKARCSYPQGAPIFVKLQKDDEDDGLKPSSSRGITSTRRATQKNVYRFHLSSDATVRDLKLKLYEKTRQTPSDQLICLGERALEDKQKLGEAGVYGNNEDAPLILIAQQHVEVKETERKLEKGFRDTALSTFV